MDRTQALNLLQQEVKNENLIKHSLAVAACMRTFALKFGEDQGQWGLAGILHDLDYEYTADDSSRHALKTAEMLEPYELPEGIVHAIKAHNSKADFKSKMDIALYAVDPTTGFIIACALMHPTKKLSSVDLKRMKKRFKEKNFARGANREQIRECQKLGIELDDFLQTCLTAMQEISEDLGL